MVVTRVQYTVQPDYAATNAANIQNVMSALQANPVEGLDYSAFCQPDGATFVHIVVAKDDGTKSKIGQLAEFQEFQTALIASKPTSPPAPEDWDLVGMSHPL